MTGITVVGAGPYGLSLAAHLGARGIDHRVFGTPMQFWDKVATAGERRYLKSYCFGTNLSTPAPGFSFADFSAPRGLETYEPCSIRQFTDYGNWFQKANVDWVEPVDVTRIARSGKGFEVTLADGQQFASARVVVATGLACFEHTPATLRNLPPQLVTHTSNVERFSAFSGRDVAVIGAGQSALEAAALLHECGANPELLVRDDDVRWQTRTPRERSLWRRIRSPIAGLGSGPKAWTLTRFPGMLHHAPTGWRTDFVKHHLPAEGAWWLRDRVMDELPIKYGVSVTHAEEEGGKVTLRMRDVNGSESSAAYDHVIAGTGYSIDVDSLAFLDPRLRGLIRVHERAPQLGSTFESSVPGLHFVGPLSAMSFGPLFRFVVGAEYTSRTVAGHLAGAAR